MNKLEKSLSELKVLLIGVNGLLRNIFFYLNFLKVKRIGIGEFRDSVEKSDVKLNDLDSPLYTSLDLGKDKILAIKEKFTDRLDSSLYFYEVINTENILQIIENYDIIFDCTNKIFAHYIINDACIFMKKFLIIGNIFEYNIEIYSILPFITPCYRCISPLPISSGFSPLYERQGVYLPSLGLASILLIDEMFMYLNLRDRFASHMVSWDLLTQTFYRFKLSFNAQCLICSHNPKITTLEDSLKFCKDKINKIEHKGQI